MTLIRAKGDDSKAFRNSFGRFATGVAVATCAPPEAAPIGMTINSMVSVSLDPPLALFCIVNESACLKAFLDAGHFAFNILPEGAEALSNHYAGNHDLAHETEIWASGAPVLKSALAVADCQLQDAIGGGDHTILMGRVLEVGARDGAPLLYFGGGYRRLADT